jgi:hypothetical protein
MGIEYAILKVKKNYKDITGGKTAACVEQGIHQLK